MELEALVRLIILLPLAGAVFCGIIGLFVPALRRQEPLSGTVAPALVAVPFVLAVCLFSTFDGQAQVATFYTWMAARGLSLDFAYRIDQLSLIMMLIVTGVGTLILIYSIGYMKGARGYWKSFAELKLLMIAVPKLVSC